jgi:hypothetical protein
MSDNPKSVPISPVGNDESLEIADGGNVEYVNIKPEDILALWDEWQKERPAFTDRMQGEFTVTEFSRVLGCGIDAAYSKIRKMLAAGFLTKRQGYLAGRHVVYYKKTNG